MFALIRKMTTFVRYILSYKKSDCAYGDVARDMLKDNQIKRTWGYRTLKAYLETRACGRVMDLIESLYEDYQKFQSALYKEVRV